LKDVIAAAQIGAELADPEQRGFTPRLGPLLRRHFTLDPALHGLPVHVMEAIEPRACRLDNFGVEELRWRKFCGYEVRF
jgi:hypothetical protein